jgi:hypothetical protein
VRLREEQQHLIDDRREAETTLYALKRILNASDSQKIELADQQDFFQTPPFDLSDPLVTALAQRPELHALDEGNHHRDFCPRRWTASGRMVDRQLRMAIHLLHQRHSRSVTDRGSVVHDGHAANQSGPAEKG